MKFSRGDIVVNGPGFKSGCFVIVDVNPSNPKNVYSGINVLTKKKFLLSDESLGEKIGVATSSGLETVKEEQQGVKIELHDARFIRGQNRACNEAMLAQNLVGVSSFSLEREKWKFLSELKPGQEIQIRHNGKLVPVIFNYVCEQGVKYVFAATMRGKSFRFPLGSLVVENPESMSNARLLEAVKLTTKYPSMAERVSADWRDQV